MQDEDGDGDVDLDDCRELLRGPPGEGGGEGGDLAPDADVDLDGVTNAQDNCIFTPNDGQEDLDLDGLGDECDPDRDGDGFANDADCWPDDGTQVPGARPDVTCDGLDDDCDGDVDEDFTPSPCDTGELGVCSAGTLECFNGAPDCVQDVAESDEVCDDLDNDCDGETDEDDGQGACGPELNGDLGGIPFCGEVAGQGGARIGVFNSRNNPVQRHAGYANWRDFCVANGWDDQHSGAGNSDRPCAEVMDRMLSANVLAGQGSWGTANYPPNRPDRNGHVFHTCIIYAA